MNVGEYNTLDLVKDNTKKEKQAFSIFFICCIIFETQEEGQTMSDSRCNLDVVHKMAAVCERFQTD